MLVLASCAEKERHHPPRNARQCPAASKHKVACRTLSSVTTSFGRSSSSWMATWEPRSRRPVLGAAGLAAGLPVAAAASAVAAALLNSAGVRPAASLAAASSAARLLLLPPNRNIGGGSVSNEPGTAKQAANFVLHRLIWVLLESPHQQALALRLLTDRPETQLGKQPGWGSEWGEACGWWLDHDSFFEVSSLERLLCTSGPQKELIHESPA